MSLAFGRKPEIALLLCFNSICFLNETCAEEVPLRERLLSSAVRIRYERSEGTAKVTGHGTAFAVDLSKWGYAGPKYLLSAAHNVLDENNQPFTTLKVESRNPCAPSWSSCRVVAFDKDLDLCLVEASDSVPEQSVLAGHDVEVGQSVTLAGSPRGVPLELYDGNLTQCSVSGTEHSSACLPFDHGCSGGPFFNAKGEVIGVAVAGVPKDGDMDKSIGLFVPLAGVTRFMESNRAGHSHDKLGTTGEAKSNSIPSGSEGTRETEVKNSPPSIEFEQESVGQLPAAPAPTDDRLP